jgi:hypothetical protein
MEGVGGGEDAPTEDLQAQIMVRTPMGGDGRGRKTCSGSGWWRLGQRGKGICLGVRGDSCRAAEAILRNCFQVKL